MELVLKGGYVLSEDGLIAASVLIQDDRIAAVVPAASKSPLKGDDVLDCTGLVVAPGLIDVHSHDDVAVTKPEYYEAKIRQGVTTTTIGMDGIGYAPIPAEHVESVVQYWQPVDGNPGLLVNASLAEQGRSYAGRIGLNVILHAPHANFRIAETGFENRLLSSDQLTRAQNSVATALDQGALGLTTGLSYVPAVFSTFNELLHLTRPLAALSLPYISHVRSYGLDIFHAIDEAVKLGEALNIPIHISHLHLSHPKMFGRAEELLDHLQRAIQRGIQLTWDLYPYSAGSSILHSYLPTWLTEGGPYRLISRLTDPRRVKQLTSDPEFASFDWTRVVIASTETGRYVGQSVADIANQRHLATADAVAQILTTENLRVSCLVHQTDSKDDDLLATANEAIVGSDGLPFGQKPHPRCYAAFPAFYDRYVRQLRTMTLDQAIRKMSTQSADLYGLTERGRIRPAAKADLMIFDPNHYIPMATYEEPRRYAGGVHHVLVNGRLVLRNGVFNGSLRTGEIVAR